MAAVAEHEREMISQRTRAALQAAKARGTKLGSPAPHNGAQRAAQTHRQCAVEYRARVIPLLNQLQAEGITSLKGLARILNQRNVRTARGGRWYARTVKNVLDYPIPAFAGMTQDGVFRNNVKITYCFDENSRPE